VTIVNFRVIEKSNKSKKGAASELKKIEIAYEKDECVSCGKNVTRDGIQWEICDKWNHSKCVGITAEAYEFISSNVQTHWYCNS